MKRRQTNIPVQQFALACWSVGDLYAAGGKGDNEKGLGDLLRMCASLLGIVACRGGLPRDLEQVVQKHYETLDRLLEQEFVGMMEEDEEGSEPMAPIDLNEVFRDELKGRN